jgi:hypothetical protein
MRTKGRVEAEFNKLEFKTTIIYKPGLLLNRDGDKRTGEKVLGWIPLITKVESSDVGRCMLENAIVEPL